MQKLEKVVAGTKFELISGYLALQANGSVLAKFGDTVVLATAVIGKVKENVSYFPLLVDYEERLYAAGKIKGSRFIKREGRATDDAILTGRLIDRGIRPLFDDDLRNDVQVVVTVLSVDEVNDPDILACNAASAALAISDIPWNGPLATVRVGKVNGNYLLNPSYEEKEQSTLDLVVSGNGEHILMVEAGAKLVSEEEIIAGIRFAEPPLKQIVEWQKKIDKEQGKAKAEVARFQIRDEIKKTVEE